MTSAAGGRERDPLLLVVAGIAVLALAFSIVAVAIANSERSSPVATPAAVVPSGPIAVTTTDFAFAPKRMKAVAGAVQFVITNRGAVVHNLEIPGVAKSPDVAPGTTLEWDAGELEPGTYDVDCVVSGHREAGMRATLTVT